MLVALLAIGRDSTGGHPPPPYRPGRDESLSQIAMWLFLASIAMVFVALFVLYAVTSDRPEFREAVQSVALPPALWLSTGILLASSVTFFLARTSLRYGRIRRFIGLLTTTLVLGLAFLAAQIGCWLTMTQSGLPINRNLFINLFYAFSGIHLLHVLGGLVPLAYITIRARSGRYTPARHAAVNYVAMYWYLMDGVWLMFVLLLFRPG